MSINYISFMYVINSNNIKHLIISGILFMLSISFVRSTITTISSNKRLEDLQAEVNTLEERKTSLESEISYKETDEYIEERARNDLSLIKEGEKVYVLSGNKSMLAPISAKDTTSVLSSVDERTGRFGDYRDSNWYMWYRLFF